MFMPSVTMLSVIDAECPTSVHYVEGHYAECHYSECGYAECHGALACIKRRGKCQPSLLLILLQELRENDCPLYREVG